jgi:hypothetical protein
LGKSTAPADNDMTKIDVDKISREQGSDLIAELRPLAQGDIIVYALMASLTRFIPMFLVDDAVETALMNIMIKRIAAAHKLPLSASDIGILASSPWDLSTLSLSSSLRRVAEKVLEKTTVIFTAKHTVEAFSKNYHIGYLVDFACQQNWATKYPSIQLRQAIDRTCDGTDMSPFYRVAVAILQTPGTLLEGVGTFLRSKVIGGQDQAQALDASLEELPAEAKSIAEKLRTALDLMPPEYLSGLRQRLKKELGL